MLLKMSELLTKVDSVRNSATFTLQSLKEFVEESEACMGKEKSRRVCKHSCNLADFTAFMLKCDVSNF